MNILEIKNLNKTFVIEKFFAEKLRVIALRDVNLSVEKGMALGILGESGSGKTTLAKITCGLMEKDGGEIIIVGRSLGTLKSKELSKNIQLIFQNPYDSLNPRLTVGVHLSEALSDVCGKMKNKKAEELLDKVGLSGDFMKRFPHQLSGGQRQRVAIARAIAPNPDIIIADEPVSSLDISIQTQILNLFKSLKKESDITFIFISHDILATAYLADEIAVMKDGRVIEIGETEKIIRQPVEEYTKKLINSMTFV